MRPPQPGGGRWSRYEQKGQRMQAEWQRKADAALADGQRKAGARANQQSLPAQPQRPQRACKRQRRSSVSGPNWEAFRLPPGLRHLEPDRLRKGTLRPECTLRSREHAASLRAPKVPTIVPSPSFSRCFVQLPRSVLVSSKALGVRGSVPMADEESQLGEVLSLRKPWTEGEELLMYVNFFLLPISCSWLKPCHLDTGSLMTQ